MKWTKLSEKLPNIDEPVLIRFKPVKIKIYDPKKGDLYTEYMVGNLESGTSVEDSKWLLSDLEYNYDPKTRFDSWVYIKDIEASCDQRQKKELVNKGVIFSHNFPVTNFTKIKGVNYASLSDFA